MRRADAAPLILPLNWIHPSATFLAKTLNNFLLKASAASSLQRDFGSHLTLPGFDITSLTSAIGLLVIALSSRRSHYRITRRNVPNQRFLFKTWAAAPPHQNVISHMADETKLSHLLLDSKSDVAAGLPETQPSLANLAETLLPPARAPPIISMHSNSNSSDLRTRQIERNTLSIS
jgi:hypothetical protein